MAFFKHLNDQSDITDIILKDHKRFAPLSKFAHNVLRGPSPFTIAERELMAAYVSGLNECRFCHGAHSAVAENFGVSSKLIESLLENINNAI